MEDNTNTNNKLPRLLAKGKRIKGSVKYTIWITPSMAANLMVLKAVYARILGRDVSASIMLRRAVQVLRGNLEEKVKVQDKEGLALEAARLMALVR